MACLNGDFPVMSGFNYIIRAVPKSTDVLGKSHEDFSLFGCSADRDGGMDI